MSTIKYHVNLETYEVSVCSAKIECRFANNADVRHFDKNDIENALKYAEELAEKKYSVNSNLSKKTTRNELNHVEANEKYLPYDELKSRKKKYFSNLEHASSQEKNTARKEELKNILDRYKTRRNPNKQAINEINGAILDGSDSSIINAMKLLKKRNDHNLRFIHELSDEEIVDTIRDSDLLDDHISFYDNSHVKTNLEENVMLASSEITPEIRERLHSAAEYAINDTRFKGKEYYPFGRVPVAIGKLNLKKALKSNDDQRILKNLKKLKSEEWVAINPNISIYMYKEEWEEYNKPMVDIVKECNHIRYKQAIMNITQK